MPRNKNTRAAQGTGTIRKKTVNRNGKPYEFWEARYTVGRDTRPCKSDLQGIFA